MWQAFRFLMISLYFPAFIMGCQPLTDEINVYSGRHYSSDEALFKKFTGETGIRVNLVKAETDQLINRLKMEGMSSRADLLITADAGRMIAAMNDGLLQPVTAQGVLTKIPSHLCDPDGHWFALTKRARIIVYSRDRVNPSELTTYHDLASPQWKGRVLVRSSQSHYNQTLLASIIAADGPEKAETWARGLVDNMAQPPRGNDRDQVKSLAAGIGDVAIVNTYYMGLLLKSPNPEEQSVAQQAGIFFPDQDGRGAHVNISGMGVTAASRNKENAIKLMEFMLSNASQQFLSEENHEYPVNPETPWPEMLEEWGRFKEDTVALSKLGDFLPEAMLIFNRAGWN
jgi:iron(III) transport system substrate-binding protein